MIAGRSTYRRIMAAVKRVEAEPVRKKIQQRRGPRMSSRGSVVVTLVRVVRTAATETQHGDDTNQCGYEYDVYPYTGAIDTTTILMTGAAPIDGRPEFGWLEYVTAENSSGAWGYGEMFTDPDTSELVLKCVDCEKPKTYGCDCTCN